MTVYFNSYIRGEGYVLKRTAGDRYDKLEDIRQKDMNDKLSRIFFTENGAYLFAGELDGRVFFCIRQRMIGPVMKDESGRSCYIDAAFEGGADEKESIYALAAYALGNKEAFCALIYNSVTYESIDYGIDSSVMGRLFDKAKDTPVPKEFFEKKIALLIPAVSAEAFLSAAGIDAGTGDIALVMPLDKWGDADNGGFRLFLYCSTPAIGFRLYRVEPETGLLLYDSCGSYSELYENEDKFLSGGGLTAGLFREKDRLCMIVKDICSTSEEGGILKQMTLIADAYSGGEQLLCGLAVSLLSDYKRFCRVLTDSVNIYDDSLTISTDRQKLAGFLSLAGKEYDNAEKLLAAFKCRKYPLIASDISLEYMCKGCGVNVNKKDIGVLIEGEDLERIKEGNGSSIEILPSAHSNEKNAAPAKSLSGGEAETTNNRMELTAVIKALECLKESCEVTVTTDSKYVCDAINKGWVYSWQKNGWRKADKKPALNVDLWTQLLALLEKHKVAFVWVKGHDGHPYNERCDALAVAESRRFSD
mgnify:CR=1 FL=1